jgi:hypothetical protein
MSHNDGMQDDERLIPGERLLWSGQPQRLPIFERGDLFAVPYSLFVCAFLAFWFATAVRFDGSALLVIPGVPLAGYALYLLFGRLIVRRIRLGSTRYTVTDRRLIERSARPSAAVRMAYLRDLAPPIVRVNDGETIGTVAFGQFPGIAETYVELNPNLLWRGRPKPFVLKEIEQASYVCDLIARAQSSLNLPSA